MTVSDPGGSATSTIVSNLQVGTQYQVRVGAKTELGVGPNNYGTTQVTAYNGVKLFMLTMINIKFLIISLTYAYVMFTTTRINICFRLFSQ